MNEELQNQKSSIDLIEYRLGQFEVTLSNNFDKLSDKLDKLISKMSENEVKQENLKTRLEKLEKDFSKIQSENEKISSDMTHVKVSIAEKLSWGTGGGIFGAIILKLLEGLVK